MRFRFAFKREERVSLSKFAQLLDEWHKANKRFLKAKKEARDKQGRISELLGQIADLEDKIATLSDENDDLKGKIEELQSDDGAKLLEWFDWECLTYHQRERVKRFSEVMRGYVTYEEFYANNIR